MEVSKCRKAKRKTKTRKQVSTPTECFLFLMESSAAIEQSSRGCLVITHLRIRCFTGLHAQREKRCLYNTSQNQLFVPDGGYWVYISVYIYINKERHALGLQRTRVPMYRRTCLVRLPPRFMVPEPVLLVCSHSITVEVSL